MAELETEEKLFWSDFQPLQNQHWIHSSFRGEGDFVFSGDLYFAGHWKGRIVLKSQETADLSRLFVLESAVISGELQGEEIIVAGRLEDIKIEAKVLRLKAGAFVRGQISCQRLIMDEGAIFEGEITKT